MTARVTDINGFVSIENNPISRVGVFPYSGAQIGAPEPNRIYYVYRPPEELADPECIESFKLKPIINDHTMLGPAEEGYTPAEEKGIEGTTGEAVAYRNGVLYSNLKIFSETLKRLLNAGKKDLSLAYRCIYEKSAGVFNGQDYQYVQRKLRGNHLALVDRARCAVAVLDSQDAMDSFDLNLKGINMTEEEKKAKEAADAAVIAEKSREAADAAVAQVAKALEALTKRLDTMDSMTSQADTLSKQVQTLTQDGFKAFTKQIKERDSLAEKLSAYIGTFDSSEMTTAEVAKYGLEKLGLTAPAGAEKAALDGFLHNRPAPHTLPIFESQKGEGGTITKFVQKHKGVH